MPANAASNTIGVISAAGHKRMDVGRIKVIQRPSIEQYITKAVPLRLETRLYISR
jgi:hypothetical protein